MTTKLEQHEFTTAEYYISQGIRHYYTDKEGKAFFDPEGKKRIYCSIHKRTQLEDAWPSDKDIICSKCEPEDND